MNSNARASELKVQRVASGFLLADDRILNVDAFSKIVDRNTSEGIHTNVVNRIDWLAYKRECRHSSNVQLMDFAYGQSSSIRYLYHLDLSDTK
jgi:hypothetical protein